MNLCAYQFELSVNILIPSVYLSTKVSHKILKQNLEKSFYVLIDEKNVTVENNMWSHGLIGTAFFSYLD